ncbi:hypothetical protein TNCT_108331 [Trichonephila clavata]|uniref:Uncharacterized protein n=1 Tax=Trichonephila clavata TaxID=2740835 RepID=A0A8X6HRS1_TRICU|nr:hypothetical protein TNCT_108331 [Trichonephila clavata]
MEITRVEQRAYIKIAVLRGRNEMEYQSEFAEALGNTVLPYRTVARKKVEVLRHYPKPVIVCSYRSFLQSIHVLAHARLKPTCTALQQCRSCKTMKKRDCWGPVMVVRSRYNKTKEFGTLNCLLEDFLRQMLDLVLKSRHH